MMQYDIFLTVGKTTLYFLNKQFKCLLCVWSVCVLLRPTISIYRCIVFMTYVHTRENSAKIMKIVFSCLTE